MNDECPIFIIQHSCILLLLSTTTNHYHSHGHRRLFALSRRHGQEDQVLLRRFSARTAKDRPHGRGRAIPGLPETRRPAAGAGARARSGLSAGDEVRAVAGHRPDRGRPSHRGGLPGQASRQSDRPGRAGHFGRRARRAGRVGSDPAGASRRRRRSVGPHVSGDGHDGRGLAPRGSASARPGPAANAVGGLRGRRSAVGTALGVESGDRHPALAARRSAAGILPGRRAVEGSVQRGRASGRCGRLADGGRAVDGIGGRRARRARHLAKPGHAPRLAGRQCRLRRRPAQVRGAASPRAATAWRTPSRPRPRPCSSRKTRWATGWKCSR